MLKWLPSRTLPMPKFLPDFRPEWIEEEKSYRCGICLTNQAVWACNPCMHLVACHACSNTLLENARKKQAKSECPICKKTRDGFLRVYFC